MRKKTPAQRKTARAKAAGMVRGALATRRNQNIEAKKMVRKAMKKRGR